MKLVDATKRAKRHPDTFQIPSDAVRAGLRPGDLAKLIFCDGKRGCERMWVIVEKADGCSYTGRLDNVPAFLRGKLGQRVRFACKNVIDVGGGRSGGGGAALATLAIGAGLLAVNWPRRA